ncbi:MAG TPA: hypothetical protein VF971_09445 [Candidatus Limnocylindrales bacterium]|jgi:hypothetical protein
MARPSRAFPAVLLGVVLAVGACGSSTPSISDPGEILARAADAIRDVRTVRVEATVEGTIQLDLAGFGPPGDISLTGTKLALDIDVGGDAARLRLEVPAVLGMTIDAILVDGATYARNSLFGDRYAKEASAGLPIAAADLATGLETLATWLEQPELAPTKEADTSCGSTSCYQVKLDLTPDEITSLVPLASDLGDGSIVMIVLVEKESLRPAGLTLDISAGGIGELSVGLTLRDWNADLDIAAPASDQVQ